MLKNFRLARNILSSACNGYLFEIGWVNSFNNTTSINKNGEPLPWATYPFIDFIDKRLSSNMNIFEYGSGNSTIYYAKKVKNLITVEHDKEWHDKLICSIPVNITLLYRQLEYKEKYVNSLIDIEKKYHLIIIDGRYRVDCIKQSIHSLTEDGVIILDDSEREQYKDGYEFLLINNFMVLDFWGISPGLFYKKCTSIFYKRNNCLNI